MGLWVYGGEPNIEINRVHLTQTESPRLDLDLYKYQLDRLSSALLVDDYNFNYPVLSTSCQLESNLVFPKDSYISGSYVINIISKFIKELPYDDIDIYFKCQKDAEDFVKVNQHLLTRFNFNSPICTYGWYGGEKLNLIYGVKYSSVEDLIGRFDIRACSVAIDPNNKLFFCVENAIYDILTQTIVFNPVPKSISVRRLEKYVKKGFTLDTYQGLFFSELVKSPIYSPELELQTKQY